MLPSEKREKYFDLVVVTPKGVVPTNELVLGGEKCLKRVDGYGFTHFLVPPERAVDLLAYDGPGERFYLTDKRAPVKVPRRVGMSLNVTEVIPHTYNGKAWVPVKDSGK